MEIYNTMNAADVRQIADNGACPYGYTRAVPPTEVSIWNGLRWVDPFEPAPAPPKPEPTDEEWNAAIIAQINALDLRRIRPLAEGDADFLAALNTQIADLRAQLRK